MTLTHANEDLPSFEDWIVPKLELLELPLVCVKQVLDKVKRARLIISLAMWNDKEEDDDLKYGRDAEGVKWGSLRRYSRAFLGEEDLHAWLAEVR